MNRIVQLLLFVLCLAAARPPQTRSDSFEAYQVGTIQQELACGFGTWRTAGDAEISTHRARTGRQALRIFGGSGKQIELELDRKLDSGQISFWAERWTRRSPFEFTVEARIRGSWKEIFKDEGRLITIGGYNACVEIIVDQAFDAVRLTCTAPEGSGILIDDFSLEPPRPMRIVSVTAEQPVLPVLLGNKINPVARLRIETEGGLDPLCVKRIDCSLSSSENLRDVARASLFFGRAEKLPHSVPDRCFPDGDRYGTTKKRASKISFPGSRTLERGTNFFWLSVELTNAANLDGWVDGGFLAVHLSDGSRCLPRVKEPAGCQRFGVAVRNAGDSGAAAFRIPGIVSSRGGALVAVYDVRYRNRGDLPGDIDVGASRSTNGGRTWEPMRIVMDMGDDPAWRHDGIGDPCILGDDLSGTLWVAATWSHGNRSWNGSGPGLTPEETGQLMLVKSENDGLTWSKPINITSQVKDPAWCFVLASPGRGLTMADGTLVLPAQFQDTPGNGRTPFSTIIYSHDRGKRWQIGKGVKANTTECRVVELEPGTLMINSRDNRGGARSVHVTRDMGETWEVHPTSRIALPEPVCNAGLLRVKSTGDPRKPWLVFSNPAVDRPPRRNMTIRLSTDGGMTWPAARQIVLDEGECAGYSSLTLIDEETIGLFYESSRAHLAFQRILIDDFFRSGAPGKKR